MDKKGRYFVSDVIISISAASVAFVWFWHFGIATLIFMSFFVFLFSVDMIYFKLEKIEKAIQHENPKHC